STTTGVLPKALASSKERSIAWREVCSPPTTSTNVICSTGLKKCILHTRPGCFRPVASSDETIEEEYEASIVCASAILSSSANSSCLSSKSSMTPSTTKEEFVTAVSRSVVNSRFWKRASTAASLTRWH